MDGLYQIALYRDSANDIVQIAGVNDIFSGVSDCPIEEKRTKGANITRAPRYRD
jgi:hypothetical protein